MQAQQLKKEFVRNFSKKWLNVKEDSVKKSCTVDKQACVFGIFKF